MFVAVLILSAVLIPFVVGALVLPLITGNEPDPVTNGAAARAKLMAANNRAVAAGDIDSLRLDTAIRGYDKGTVDELIVELSRNGSVATVPSIAVVRGGYRMDETDAVLGALGLNPEPPRV